MKGIPFIGVNQ